MSHSAQLLSEQRFEWHHCHFSTPALDRLCHTSTPVILLHYLWSPDSLPCVARDGGLGADHDRRKIGSRKWYLDLSCQKLVIPDPNQPRSTEQRGDKSPGQERRRTVSQSDLTFTQSLHCTGVYKEHIQEDIRGEEKVYSLQQWKCSGLALP